MCNSQSNSLLSPYPNCLDGSTHCIQITKQTHMSTISSYPSSIYSLVPLRQHRLLSQANPITTCKGQIIVRIGAGNSFYPINLCTTTCRDRLSVYHSQRWIAIG